MLVFLPTDFIKEPKDLDFFIVETHGFGKYARPLVDIFYLPHQKNFYKIASEGLYLNQVLLDQGLATEM